MMYSQNGYSAKVPTLIASYTVPGSTVRINLRKGDTSVVLLYVAEQFNKRVQKLRQSDTGGYNPRSIIGGVTLSNHASGTAIDVRWNDHPIGRVNTFSDAEEREIQKILAEVEGTVRWGGNYLGRKDEMHFEIVGSPSKVTAVANKIRGGTIGQKPASKPTESASATLSVGSVGGRVSRLQAGLNKTFPAYSKLKVDGEYGPKLEAVVKEFQKRTKLSVDGKVGPNTTKKLNSFGINF